MGSGVRGWQSEDKGTGGSKTGEEIPAAVKDTAEGGDCPWEATTRLAESLV